MQKLTTGNGRDEQTADSASVRGIQEKAQAIDLEKNYETKVLDNDQFLDHVTDGGRQLTGYFKDGKAAKIVEKIGMSYGVITYEYYFSNEELILAKENEEDFPYAEDTGSLDYAKAEPSFRGEYYFKDRKLIDSRIKGQKRSADGLSKDINNFIQMSEEKIELFKEQK